MEVRITNEHTNRHKDDICFEQPKYYFGQLVRTLSGKSGIVVEMFSVGWQYVLLDPETNRLIDSFEEALCVAVSNEKWQDTLPPMTIKISNKHLEAFNCSLRFTQPKYYFGQLLNFPDKEGVVGVVTEMQFKQGGYTSKYAPGLPKKIEAGWHYELVEISEEFLPHMIYYTEQQLLNKLLNSLT